MKNIIRLSVLSIVLCFVTGAYGQKRQVRVGADYSFGLPAGDLQQFVENKTSARGWNIRLMFNISNSVSAGASLGYQDFFKQYSRQLFHMEGTDVSGVLINSAELMPLLAKIKYSFLPQSLVHPYIAGGAGIDMVLYRQTIGEYDLESHDRIAFHASPEAGISLFLGSMKNLAFNLGACYNFIPFNHGEVNNLNYAAFKAGLSLSIKN